MEKDAVVAEEESQLSTLEEEVVGQNGKTDGRGSRLSKYIKIQTYLTIKDVVTLDEQKLRFMKQGMDVSRGRLISEAIRLLAREVSEGRLDLKAQADR